MRDIELSVFRNKNLFEAGTEFFSQLGINFHSHTASELNLKDILKNYYVDKKENIFHKAKSVFFLGRIDDTIFEK